MKNIDVCGVCNGLVDIFADVTEEQFEKLGFERGTMRLVEAAEQKQILATLGTSKPVMMSGGSVANSIIAIAQLGGKSAMTTRLADDDAGRFYREECSQMGITMPTPFASSGATGMVVSLVTPDAERTMRTSLGVCVDLAPEHLDVETISDSSWLFIEGYVFSNSDAGRSAALEAASIARSGDTKIAVTCSEPWVVGAFGEPLNKVLAHADLVFCNEEESLALTGATSIEAAGEALAGRFPHVVITGGPKGAFLWWRGIKSHVPAFPCEPRDLTGAGDMFAGAFLYGITHGYTPDDAARKACYLAREVISQVGARLKGDVKSLWAAA